jgi:NAD(P)-dependent dehydrogenase (short-subunit alcohol dehydrogenase family)
MIAKTVLITGATSGIGKVTAIELARMGFKVVIAGRSEEKCIRTLEEIREASFGKGEGYLVADLSIQNEVQRLASEFKERYKRLDVLVNNAGGIFSKRTETSDGIEYTFALNHLAYFLLTNLLLDMLRRSAPSRVVSVSSGIHKSAEIDFDDLGTKKGYSAFKAYGRSKLANVMFTYELARRLEVLRTGVTATVMNPGFTRTGFGRNNKGFFGLMTKASNAIGAKKVEEGARTLIWLASSPNVEGVTGKYFEDMKDTASSRLSYDEDAVKKLWDISAFLTGVSFK